MGEKENILVLGTSGTGKSTLINAVIGKKVAKVDCGFEYSFLNTKKVEKDMRTWMKSGLFEVKPDTNLAKGRAE